MTSHLNSSQTKPSKSCTILWVSFYSVVHLWSQSLLVQLQLSLGCSATLTCVQTALPFRSLKYLFVAVWVWKTVTRSFFFPFVSIGGFPRHCAAILTFHSVLKIGKCPEGKSCCGVSHLIPANSRLLQIVFRQGLAALDDLWCLRVYLICLSILHINSLLFTLS